MDARRGLSLIELLIVIAIISLLAGLLLPALTRAKARAHTIYCANNLRQWGIATHLYTADHGDFLPPDGRPNPDENDTNAGWYVALPHQINLPRYHDQLWRTNPAVAPGRSLWICPANRRRSNGRNLFHYCLNEHVNGTGAEDRPMLLSSISRPSAVVWLFDTKNLPAVGYWSFVHTNLHQQGANFLFLDSHVQRFPVAANLPGRANTNNPAIMWIP